jgi:pre-mRNA-processing factor 8
MEWNYNFIGSSHSPAMRYSLKIDIPKDFYHEKHRPSHFLNFAEMEDAVEVAYGAGVDRDSGF